MTYRDVRRSWLFRASMLTAIVFVGTAAAAHVPSLQRLAARAMPPAGVCPFGGKQAGQSPQERDAQRAKRARLLAGEGPSRDLLAYGMVLNATTLAEARTWAHARGLLCRPLKLGGTLQCDTDEGARVDGSFATARSLSGLFDFDSRGKLKEARFLARFPSASQAAAAYAQRLRASEQQAGAASTCEGDASAEALAAGLLRQARATFKREDLYAVVSVTNGGDQYHLIHQLHALAP